MFGSSIEATPIEGLVAIRRKPHTDIRGSLDRLFDLDVACSLIPDFAVSQVNHTVTNGRGTVRGLHYQMPPFADAKIVTCLRGRVLDVAVDLRQGSPTFLDWHSTELSEGDGISMLLSPGLAHGFQLLDNGCELLYLHGERYRPDAEGGLNPQDPLLDIPWPEPISLMSERDSKHPMIDPGWPGITV